MFVIVNPNWKIWGGNEFYNSTSDAMDELKSFWGPLLSRVNFKIVRFDEYKSTLSENELREILSRDMVVVTPPKAPDFQQATA